jgi:hypothetical protein
MLQGAIERNCKNVAEIIWIVKANMEVGGTKLAKNSKLPGFLRIVPLGTSFLTAKLHSGSPERIQNIQA